MNQTPQIHRVLAPIDASGQCERVVAAAATVASSMNAAVHIVHVDPDAPALDTDVDTESPGAASKLVTAAVDRLRADGITAEGTVMHGADSDVDDLLLIEARRVGADLIVIGADHRHGLSALLEPSVSKDVVRRANVWVLLVP